MIPCPRNALNIFSWKVKGTDKGLTPKSLSHVSPSQEDEQKLLLPTGVDAFVVVYSVEDRRSFEAAIDCLYDIREAQGPYVSAILVGNKSDLVRTRLVQDDGKGGQCIPKIPQGF